MPFVKGQSGNPGGRKKGGSEIVELARKHAPEAITRLAALMADENGKVAVAACNSILDRAYGKPVQQVTGEDGGPVKLEIAADGIVDVLKKLAGEEE